SSVGREQPRHSAAAVHRVCAAYRLRTHKRGALAGVWPARLQNSRALKRRSSIQKTTKRSASMKGKSLAWIFSAALAGTSLSGVAQAQEQFVTIGTGGQTGVYYVA